MVCDIRYCLTRDPDTTGLHQDHTGTAPKIFWELNWLDQRNPMLIQFIKEKILIPPPRVQQPLNLLEPFDKKKPWKHQGTHGEALAVESIYGLKRKKKIGGKENSKQTIIK